MGIEKGYNSGIVVEDVKLALKGHVKDGYQVRSFELLTLSLSKMATFPNLMFNKIYALVPKL